VRSNLKRHALDAAELSGGYGADLIVNDGQSAGREEHYEVFESIVHEVHFGANLSVELRGPGLWGLVSSEM
jgi:hypothetical protein